MQVNYPPQNFTYFLPPPPNAVTAQPAQAAAPITPTLPAPSDDDGTFQDLSPLMQQQQLAANALQEGSSTASAQGGLATGLARLAEAVSGGYSLNKATNKINSAKEANAQVMINALNNGDWAKLSTSDNDQANKLGDSLLQAQLKHMQTDRLLTEPEITAAGLPRGTVASKNMNGEIKILNRPNTGLPRGYQYADNPADPEGPQIQTIIPGGPADPAVINKNAAGRAAAIAATKTADQSGVEPWLRKW